MVQKRNIACVTLLGIVFVILLKSWPTKIFSETPCFDYLYAYTKNHSNASISNVLQGNIKIIKTSDNVCNLTLESHTSLLVVVKSYIGNFDQRLAIRRTWGKDSKRKFILVFMVGRQGYAEKLLFVENGIHNDIVQGSFEDKYDHNIIKTMMAYTWVVDFCANVKYVLFIDDDCLLNIEYLLHAITINRRFRQQPAMYGYKVLGKPYPEREKASRHFVSFTEYGCPFYPEYLTGGAILTDISVVEQINAAFKYVKYIHIDDVYLGMVAYVLDIPQIDEKKISNYYVDPHNMTYYFVSHKYGKRGYLETGWNILNYVKQLQVSEREHRHFERVKHLSM